MEEERGEPQEADILLHHGACQLKVLKQERIQDQIT
jgi:hypothetical protein